MVYSAVVRNEPDLPPDLRHDVDQAIGYLKSVGCTEIFLFGSVAVGDFSDTSDLDIAVRGIRPSVFFEVYGELMSRVSRPVDLIDLDLQQRFGSQLIAHAVLRRVA